MNFIRFLGFACQNLIETFLAEGQTFGVGTLYIIPASETLLQGESLWKFSFRNIANNYTDKLSSKELGQ